MKWAALTLCACFFATGALAQPLCDGSNPLLCRQQPLQPSAPNTGRVYQNNGLSITDDRGHRWDRLNQDTYIGIGPGAPTCRVLGSRMYCQ
jgi:hypothetical protein